jgi:hypothetical protein
MELFIKCSECVEYKINSCLNVLYKFCLKHFKMW